MMKATLLGKMFFVLRLISAGFFQFQPDCPPQHSIMMKLSYPQAKKAKNA
jgi:hypothetical protein